MIGNPIVWMIIVDPIYKDVSTGNLVAFRISKSKYIIKEMMGGMDNISGKGPSMYYVSTFPSIFQHTHNISKIEQKCA